MRLRPRLLGLLLLACGFSSACQQGEGAEQTQAPESLGELPSAPVTPGAPASPGAPAPVPTPVPTPTPTPVTYVREWVVAPTGSDSAAGSSAAPFRSIGKALSVVGPGERITVKAGTYAERVAIEGTVRAGTAAAPIRLQGEGMPRLVPGSSSSSMVAIRKPYWHVDGFEVDAQGTPKFGVVFYDATTTGSVLSGSRVHNGTAGAAVTTFQYATGVTIEGNEIHDYSRGSEDAHGVLVQYSSKNITVRNNRIHGVSGDSVQCIGPEDYSTLPPADGVLIEGNEMYSNVENGFDIKTCYNVVIRKNVMHDFDAAGVVHMSAAHVLIEDNEFFNVGKAIAIGGNHYGPVPTNVVVHRNRIRDVPKNSSGWEGNAIRLENSEGAQVVNNTIVNVGNAAIMLGGGTGGATSNLSVFNNLLQGSASVLHVGSQAPGLKVGNNLYASSAKVYVSGTGSLSFSAWMSLGRDSGSFESALPLSSGSFTPGSSAVDKGR
ncbi:MAG TPA: right-handed parallel beta-helix repeat-containing protein, partial [Aggregicoccus sp.]|nr:right-handed parallel beta-helix repeat-containing protein [Aggregicoccus sp.]